MVQLKAPVVVSYLPTGHEEHELAPEDSWKEPAPQLVQAVEPSEE